ncbi:uncharacterized protein JCM15063_005604 [Sporobolomyces koalae]|uniref:uncharacterized protein n=1 Tax=Sporobolomyces koalae TaxID=500713 RepID=UPI003177877A
MSPIAIDSTPSTVSPAAFTTPVSQPVKNGKQQLDKLVEDPLARTYRTDKEGKIKLGTRYPEFHGDKYAERQWIKEHMAGAFRWWAKQGFAEGVSGHITVVDPVLPGHYWMNPFGLHFGLISCSDLVLVSPEGRPTEGGAQLPINTAGFHIHSAIHEARPDIKAAAHCHSINGKAWSVFGKPIDLLTQDSCIFHDNLAVYSNFGGIVLAQDEGRNIAKALGPKHRAAILQNHGLLTLGDTVDETMALFTNLDRLCGVQLAVEAAAANGLSKSIIDDDDARFTAATLQNPENLYVNQQTEYNLLVAELAGSRLDFLR